MSVTTTLSDIENSPKEFLLASDIAPYLKADVGTILFYAKHKPELLGFPVIVTGKMVRIPKHAFVYFCRYGRPVIDYNLLSYVVAKANEVDLSKVTE